MLIRVGVPVMLLTIACGCRYYDNREWELDILAPFPYVGTYEVTVDETMPYSHGKLLLIDLSKAKHVVPPIVISRDAGDLRPKPKGLPLSWIAKDIRDARTGRSIISDYTVTAIGAGGQTFLKISRR